MNIHISRSEVFNWILSVSYRIKAAFRAGNGRLPLATAGGLALITGQLSFRDETVLPRNVLHILAEQISE